MASPNKQSAPKKVYSSRKKVYHSKGRPSKAADPTGPCSISWGSRSFSRMNTPGVPGKKVKRKFWYEGPPLIWKNEKEAKCSVYSSR